VPARSGGFKKRSLKCTPLLKEEHTQKRLAFTGTHADEG